MFKVKRKESCSFSYRFAHDSGVDEIVCMCTMLTINTNKSNSNIQLDYYMKNINKHKDDVRTIMIGELY